MASKTQVAIPNKESLPTELTAAPQWVLWRFGPPINGRPGKLPYDTKGEVCDANDPANWCTFSRAVAACIELGFDGVGFAHPASLKLVALDLDDCRDPVTGELTAAAQAVIERFSSYCEITPSRTGIRVWLWAPYPEGPYPKVGYYRGTKIEVFRFTGFVTVTGARLDGSPLRIEHRASEFAAFEVEIFPPEAPAACPAASGAGRLLSDEQLVERVRLDATGNRLWTGDKSDFMAAGGGEPDDSAADFALLMLLRRWSRDAAQLERVFGLSRLGERDKWRERADYRQGSIAKALETAPFFEFDEIGDKDRFVDQHGPYVLFVEGLEYGAWSGSRWLFSEHDDQWARRAELTLRQLRRDAAQMEEAFRKSATTYARRIQTRRSILGIVHQARTDPRVRADTQELDSNPYAINFENKMGDLKENK